MQNGEKSPIAENAESGKNENSDMEVDENEIKDELMNGAQESGSNGSNHQEPGESDEQSGESAESASSSEEEIEESEEEIIESESEEEVVLSENENLSDADLT